MTTTNPTGTCQCGKPAHETRTGLTGSQYQVCFACAQDWQAVLVRKEDVPQVAAVGRRLYKRAAEDAGYKVTGTTRNDEAALHRIRAARATADGKWAQILDIVLDEIEQGAAPEDVITQVLTLMQRVRAENTAA